MNVEADNIRPYAFQRFQPFKPIEHVQRLQRLYRIATNLCWMAKRPQWGYEMDALGFFIVSFPYSSDLRRRRSAQVKASLNVFHRVDRGAISVQTFPKL